MTDTSSKPINWLSRNAVPDHVKVPIYKMSTNENPLGPSPQVIETIQRHVSGLGEYPPTNDMKLREVMAEVHGNGLTPQHFFTSLSGCEGLDFIARAYLQPDDESIICSPAFGVYGAVTNMQKANIVDVPLDSEHLTHKIDAILDAVTDRTRLLFLCNPHNPAGTIITSDDMETLYSNLPDRVLIIADEVYCHYVNHPNFPDTVKEVLAHRNVVILYSFSKAFGLGGLRLGYGMARPDIIALMAPFQRTFHLSTLHIEAGIAALKDQDHVKNSVDITLKGKAWLYEQFERLGLKTWPSESNFILVRLPVPSYDVAVRLLDYGVIVMPQAKSNLPDCIRVTIGTPAGNKAFIDALETILQN